MWFWIFWPPIYRKRCFIYLISAVLPVIASVLLLSGVNKTTVVIYVLFYTLSVVLYEFGFDVTRNLILKKLNMYDSIAEYQCAIEGVLQTGRMIAFGIMAIFGLITANFSLQALQLSVKIFSAIGILVMSVLNIWIAQYEKRFLKVVMTKE